MNKKKIFFVAPRFHTNQFFLTKNLIKEGHNVKFYVIYTSLSENYSHLKPIVFGKNKFLTSLALFVNRIDKNTTDINFLRKYTFPRFNEIIAMYKEKPDFVIVRDFSPYYSKIVIFIGLFFPCTKIVLYTQNKIHHNGHKFYKIFFNYVLEKLGISHYSTILGNIKEKKLGSKIRYLPHVMDLNISEKEIAEKAKLLRETECVKIVIIGKLVPRKNIYETIKHLNAFKLNYIVTIICECTTEMHNIFYEDLISKVKTLPNYDKLIFKLNLEHSNVLTELKNSHLFIILSEKELASISNLEAMSCANGIIINDDNGSAEYSIDNENGYVLPNKNKFEIFEKKLQELSIDKIIEFGEKSYNIIKERHSVENYLTTLNQLNDK